MSRLLKIVVITVTAKIIIISVERLYHIKSLPLLCFVNKKTRAQSTHVANITGNSFD